MPEVFIECKMHPEEVAAAGTASDVVLRWLARTPNQDALTPIDIMALKKAVALAILDAKGWTPPPPPPICCVICGMAGRKEEGILVHTSRGFMGHSFTQPSPCETDVCEEDAKHEDDCSRWTGRM